MGFSFSQENTLEIEKILNRYPPDKKASALLPLLDLAQRQLNGYLTKEALETIADFLALPVIRVMEVASFYTLFNLNPVGQYHLKVCGTTPCWLRNAPAILNACKEYLQIDLDETTKDGLFTLSEFECLGACVNGPVVQINDDYIEDVDPEQFIDLLEKLRQGDRLQAFSCKGRKNARPVGDNTTC